MARIPRASILAIPFAGAFGGLSILAQGGADAFDFVGSHAYAGAGPAEQHGLIKKAGSYLLRYLQRHFWPHSRRIQQGAEYFYRMPPAAKVIHHHVSKVGFHVASYRYFHILQHLRNHER